MKFRPLLIVLLAVLFQSPATEGKRWWGHVEFLAADALEGRDVGSPGFEKAAAYVEGQFKEMGLTPGGTAGYRQPVKFVSRTLVADATTLTLVRTGEEQPLTLREDANLSPRGELDGSVEAPMVFVGYGMSIPEAGWDDLAGLDLHGKIAVYVNVPAPAEVSDNVKSHLGSTGERWALLKRAGAIGVATLPNPRVPAGTTQGAGAIGAGRGDAGRGDAGRGDAGRGDAGRGDAGRGDAARGETGRGDGGRTGAGRGAAPAPPATAVLLADPDLQDQAGESLVLTITRRGAEKLLAGSGHTIDEINQLVADKKPLPHFPLLGTLRAHAEVTRAALDSENVIGIYEGSDPRLKREFVVMSAHLDHLGVGRPVNGDRIYNGAMDDASGVASVIEIARLLKDSGARPKRSILFMAQTGEEKGELGSKYFAAHPTVPFDAIVADINLDMFLPLYALKVIEVQGLAESSLGDTVRAAAKDLRRRRPDRSRARAEPLHPQRSIQLHPPRHPVARLQVRLRVRLAAGTGPPRLGARRVSQAERRPDPAGRRRGRGVVRSRDPEPADAGRGRSLAAALERQQLFQALSESGPLTRVAQTSATPPAVAAGREQGLRRQLTAGQMVMVAVGGSIGTGLLLGSASAIEAAGPAVILTFVLAACITWTVTLALGELASLHPAAGSFQLYGDLYLNEWAGFLSGTGYWAAIAISIGAEMVASATYMAFWFPNVPPIAWIAAASLLLLGVNLLSVARYGRFEYWFAMIKLVVVAAFIVLGAALLLAGRTAPQYTAHGGLFPNGALAALLALPFALYTFAGVEFVAVTSGESRSAAEVARATRMTFVTLTLVYLGAIVVLTGVMPWNHAGVHESPFVTVFRTVRIPGAAHLMNFAVLTAALSGANAALYAASRTLFSLARNGWAPAALGRLNRAGSPTGAVIASSFAIVVALVLERWAPQQAFVSILNAALFGLLLSWLVTLAAHVRFRRTATPAALASLPRRSALGAWGSTIGFAVIVLAILKTWWDSRLAFVSGVVYLIVLNAAYLILRKWRRGRTL